MPPVLHDKDAKHKPLGKTCPSPARRAAGPAPVRARAQHRNPSPRPRLGGRVRSVGLLLPGARLRVKAHVGGAASAASARAGRVRWWLAVPFVFADLSNSDVWSLPPLLLA